MCQAEPEASGHARTRWGYGYEEFTPGEPVELSGYVDRTTLSEGVADPVAVRAACVEVESEPIVIAVADVLGLPVEWSHNLREEICRVTGLDTDHVLLAATHNHAAPTVTRILGCVEARPETLRRLEEAFLSSVEQAVERTTPVEFSYGEAITEGIIYHRRRRMPNGIINMEVPGPAEDHGTSSIDPTIRVLAARDTNTAVKGCLVCFGTHGTVLGPNNLMISGDLPGRLCQVLDRRFGHRGSVFLSGASADVNPLAFRGSWTQLAAVSELLSDYVLRVIGSANSIELSRPRSHLADLEVPLLPVERSKVEEFLERPPERITSTHSTEAFSNTKALREWAEFTLSRYESRAEKVSTVTVHYIGWGGLAIAGIGAEVFSSTARHLRQRLGRRLWVCGYVDGTRGYLPGELEHKEGGYEVEMGHFFYGEPGPFAPEAEKRVCDFFIRVDTRHDPVEQC